MDPAPGIRVLVVDDDFAVAEVHRAYVEGIAGFSVVAVAHTGAQALHATHELAPRTWCCSTSTCPTSRAWRSFAACDRDLTAQTWTSSPSRRPARSRRCVRRWQAA